LEEKNQMNQPQDNTQDQRAPREGGQIIALVRKTTKNNTKTNPTQLGDNLSPPFNSNLFFRTFASSVFDPLLRYLL